MTLRLASPFQDHAVLQRDQPLVVWGWAPPRSLLRITLADHAAGCLSNDDGDFLARLPALPAGGPHTLVVEVVPDGERVEIRDLLVGEVWIASGQSNMNWTLELCGKRVAEDVAAAEFPEIRFFNVQGRTHLGPHRVAGGRWEIVTPEIAPRLSAVAFAFARRLHRELGVPVGVISASWSGSIIEAWMSRAALAAEPSAADWLARYEAEAWAPERWKTVPELGTNGRVNNYPRDPGVSRDWHRPDLDDSSWLEVSVPATWQSAGHRNSGVFWYRRRLSIPPAWIGRDLVLHLGAADKQDVTFVNGVEIGRTGRDLEEHHWNKKRSYAVPAALVSSPTVRIAVRVYSFVHDGGLIGPAADMRVHPADRPDEAIPLSGPWRLRREHDLGRVEIVRVAGHGEPNSPHMLYDNMIAPMAPFAVRGAIWYQGESNEANPSDYSALLHALVRDWRRTWGRPDLAFHVVQLPGFRVPLAHQDESRWARLREAQETILDLPHTGLAVAIDLGEETDIHPSDKIPVGERLARSVLARVHGRADLAPNGPRAVGFAVEGATMRVEFADAGARLTTTDGAAPRTLFLAGEDRVFHPAEGRIENATLLVTSPAVARPVAVRYAWADNPAGCNLAGDSGLPAAPFRSDRW
jgi:Domain of unknown function (DUF303).